MVTRTGVHLKLRRGAAGLALIMAAFFTGPAFAAPVFEADLLTPPAENGKPHGASLVELKNGDLLATWFSSSKETDSEARIYGAQWRAKSGQWSQPRVIVDEDYSKSVGNTALFRDDDGIIWMFFAAVRIGGWSGSMVDYIQSRDEGKTWSEGQTLVYHLGNLPRNPPIRVGGHRMLVPLFVDFMYEANLVGSYTALIDYRDGKIIDKHYASLDDYDAIQPTVVKMDDGRTLLLARDKSDRFIRRAYSGDDGKTWSPVTMTALPNPGAAVCAVYLPEIKTVLLAYNHSRKGRNPLSLAVSTDGGKTFTRVTDLEFNPEDPGASYSYPALLVTKDGMIHAIWSHDKRAALKHVRFNLEWLQERIGEARAAGK